MTEQATGLQLRSTVKREGVVEVSLTSVPIPEPKPDEVVVRIEASPINPSDVGLMFAGADLATARVAGTPDHPVVTASISPAMMRAMAGRLDQPLPVGNEGAGVVVRAGSSDQAQALVGKTVAILGGAMYAQFRSVKASQCLVLPPGTTPAAGASCFVNPLTALGMVETMRLEGHRALVHTAAASNLGQMLVKICLEDGIELVNVVRRQEHVEPLEAIGAKHVVSSAAPTFLDDLTEALAATGATLGFDAVGGGKLASQILSCMEAAANRTAKEYSRYGSTTHKQVYIYGGLDRGPTEITRNYGMAWGIGGWLLPAFLQKIGPPAAQKLRERVAAEIETTFASRYTKQVSLAEALRLEEIAVYGKLASGQKYLINPNKGLAR
ncbi:MAG: zinc-binding dehydrogenase [Deltaproteobacteria bacterium]|nr:zinc-binding dehydrogenase [Deltaproteobacteria bacterium]